MRYHIEYFGETLENGIRVGGACLPWLRTGAAVLRFRVGWRDESAEEAGITHLVEHLCFRGPNEALSQDLSQRGGFVNGRTDGEATSFIATGHESFLESGLELFSNVFKELPVDPTTLSQELEIHRHELISSGYGPADLEMGRITAQLVGDKSFGRPPLEQLKTLAKLDCDRVRAYHAAWFHPGNARITLVSPLEPSAALDRLRARFGGLRRSTSGRPERKPIDLRSNPLIVRRFPGGYCHAMIWHLVPALTPQSFPALQQMGDVLGGQPHSAMFRELRLRERMGYQFGSHLTTMSDCAILTVHGLVQQRFLLPALTFMLDQLDGLRSTGVGESAFDQSRRRLLLGLDAMEDDPSELCHFLAESDLLAVDGAVRTPEQLRRDLASLTREAFNVALADVLSPSRRTAVLFGTVGLLQSWRVGRLLRRRGSLP